MNIVGQVLEARLSVDEPNEVDVGVFVEDTGECIDIYSLSPTDALTLAKQLIESAHAALDG